MNDPEGYLHGFDPTEQQRLFEQARFLEPHVFQTFDFSACKHILEVGCGVGAQTEILLRRFPQAHVTGVDLSPKQLARATDHFNGIKAWHGRWDFLQADATQSHQLPPATFDGAYLCWILEHVANPLALLKTVRNALIPGSPICIAEVFNQSLHVEPANPTLNAYWVAYNQLQTRLGGDPNIGVKLGTLLSAAGFQDVVSWPHPLHFDSRNPKNRRAMLVYWRALLSSGVPALLTSGSIPADLPQQLDLELQQLLDRDDTIFFYNFFKATARA